MIISYYIYHIMIILWSYHIIYIILYISYYDHIILYYIILYYIILYIILYYILYYIILYYIMLWSYYIMIILYCDSLVLDSYPPYTYPREATSKLFQAGLAGQAQVHARVGRVVTSWCSKTWQWHQVRCFFMIWCNSSCNLWTFDMTSLI